MITRREFMKLAGASSAAMMIAKMRWAGVLAAPLAAGLSDPTVQPKFVELVPNALDRGFLFEPVSQGAMAGKFNIYTKQSVQQTGLRRNGTGRLLDTTIWGYGYDDERGVSWPGRTFQVQSGVPTTVRWNNALARNNGRPLPHLLPVDTSLHWAYSLPGYEHYSLKRDGVPIVTHVHGGHSAFQFDGNPEFFWSPDYEIVGPSWYRDGLNGIIKDFVYLNDQPAGNLWYHDHALGITRLNVYAGMAGFYFVRDDVDTGLPDNPLGLPAFPYELAYAIQDRMFTDRGDLFYPAFPGDPFYDDFITGEGAILPPDIFPGGGPTALAEFFGDHIVVNGKIWPKADVEPRNYRMHLLNGTDSRFMALRFRRVPAGATTLDSAGAPIPFYVIGSDQGLGRPAGSTEATQMDTLVVEPGGRYDIVFNFSGFGAGDRIIVENLGGDAPFGGAFGGDLDPDDLFPDRQTDRIMAFDVVLPLDNSVPDTFDPAAIPVYAGVPDTTTVRRVALFEGLDEFGRLQPLLGTVEDDLSAATAYTWHLPTTETPALDTTEIWEVYNFTGDAHPVHLHLVHFEILDRQEISFEVNGTQTIEQHNGAFGEAPNVENIALGAAANLDAADGYFESAPKDMVTALPEQVTRIRATFDKSGRYVWHCHILSHEDHEMMRVLQVGPGA